MGIVWVIYFTVCIRLEIDSFWHFFPFLSLSLTLLSFPYCCCQFTSSRNGINLRHSSGNKSVCTLKLISNCRFCLIETLGSASLRNLLLIPESFRRIVFILFILNLFWIKPVTTSHRATITISSHLHTKRDFCFLCLKHLVQKFFERTLL